MKCDACRVTLGERLASRHHPFQYKVDGLQIALVGIAVHLCPRCNAETPEIPRIASLHRLIAQSLIEREGILVGPEVRFLRKFSGFSAREFAERLRVEPETLSRIEQGKQKIGGAADRLVRIEATAARDTKQAVGNALKQSQPRRERPECDWTWEFNTEDRKWREAS